MTHIKSVISTKHIASFQVLDDGLQVCYVTGTGIKGITFHMSREEASKYAGKMATALTRSFVPRLLPVVCNAMSTTATMDYQEALNKAFAFYTDGRHQLPEGVYFNGFVEEGIRVVLLEIFPELGEMIRQWRAEKEAVTTPVTKAVTTPLQ